MYAGVRTARSIVPSLSAISLCPIAMAQQQSAVFLGSAGNFAVLAGTTVTNIGPSVIDGILGVWPPRAQSWMAGRWLNMARSH
jgi:hypothetical protein